MSMKIKKSYRIDTTFWCGKRGSNPYGKTTRPSNVRVCLFRHSRNGFIIIQHKNPIVKTFFAKISCIFQKT